MGWERLTLCCAVGMVKCRGDYFGIVGMTYCIRKGKKKKNFKLEICGQNSCRAYNVKRESSRKEWSLKVIMYYGLFP